MDPRDSLVFKNLDHRIRTFTLVADLTTKDDIGTLIQHFYKKVASDPILSPFFQNVHWESHLPKMELFWRFVLLDEPGYKTNVTEVHQKLPLKKEHFDHWLALFDQSVNELFKGPIADLAKQKAFHMGWTMKGKLT